MILGLSKYIDARIAQNLEQEKIYGSLLKVSISRDPKAVYVQRDKRKIGIALYYLTENLKIKPDMEDKEEHQVHTLLMCAFYSFRRVLESDPDDLEVAKMLKKLIEANLDNVYLWFVNAIMIRYKIPKNMQSHPQFLSANIQIDMFRDRIHDPSNDYLLDFENEFTIIDEGIERLLFFPSSLFL